MTSRNAAIGALHGRQRAPSGRCAMPVPPAAAPAGGPTRRRTTGEVAP